MRNDVTKLGVRNCEELHTFQLHFESRDKICHQWANADQLIALVDGDDLQLTAMLAPLPCRIKPLMAEENAFSLNVLDKIIPFSGNSQKLGIRVNMPEYGLGIIHCCDDLWAIALLCAEKLNYTTALSVVDG